MIKRSKLLTALICIILSVICVFGVVFTGCAEYNPPENNGGGNTVIDDPDDPENPSDENTNDFTVQLLIKPSSKADWQNFTYEYYEGSDGNNGVHEQSWIKWETIRVQWTNLETGARHFSTLNEDGKATCAGLDGDYKVTIINVPTGFTYDPNINYADNISKETKIDLYKIQKVISVQTLKYISAEIYYEVNVVESTGAYRAVLENKEDKIMFAYHPRSQGTYSLTSLVDVTANKINPKLAVYGGMLGTHIAEKIATKDDGGSENTYTKNIYWEYNISVDETKGSNAFFFELSSTSVDGDNSYPITVDFLIQRDGDYTRTDLSTTVEPTEDFSKTPAKPEGTFTWAALNTVTDGLIVSSKKVILNTEPGRLASYLQAGATFEMGEQATLNDGYYYFYTYNEATNTYTLTDRLYAVVNKANDVFDLGNSQLWSVRYLQDSENSSLFYNYTQFLSIYQEHCNSDGAYPVNEELAKFLQNFCVHNRLFNDGNGAAETVRVTYTDANGVTHTGGFNADEKGMWLISCGYYQQ
ncbi:MAG: hypothetical protein ACI4VK_04785 [Candidatus Coproplasma sp.]